MSLLSSGEAPDRTGLAQRSRFSYGALLTLLMGLATAYRVWFLLADRLALLPEEAQNWDWSRRLDWSYYSKPPLIAYMIAGSTAIFGSNPAGVRAGAVAISVILAAVTYRWLRALFDSSRLAFWSALALGTMPLYTAGAVTMTTDTPLLFFWATAIVALSRAVFDSGRRAWWAAGALFGLGLLAKYTMLLLAPCFGLFLLASGKHRFWLRRREPVGALALGLCFFLPVLIWNARHGWIGFRHVAGLAGLSDGWRISPKSFFEFFGSQAGVVTPLFFIALLASAAAALRGSAKADERIRFLLFLSAPVLVFFLAKSLQAKVEANWAAVAYFAWIPLAAVLLDGKIRESRAAGRSTRLLEIFAASALLLALSASAALHEPSLSRKLPPRWNPRSRLIAWEELGAFVSAAQMSMPRPGRTFIASDDYQVAAELAFYAAGQPRTYCLGSGRRMNQYDVWGGLEEKRGWDALLIARGRFQTPDAPTAVLFARIGSPEFSSIARGDGTEIPFTLWRCLEFHGAPNALPRPGFF